MLFLDCLWFKFSFHVHSKVSIPVAQIVEHGTSNGKVIGLIPSERKNFLKCSIVQKFFSVRFLF